MVQTEKVVKDLEMNYSGVFDLKEFLDIIKKYFDRHNYDLDEKSYDTKTKDDTKNVSYCYGGLFLYGIIHENQLIFSTEMK